MNSLGPAEDIIEEALNLFRPNCFTKSFDIRGPADRTLVYLLLYIGDCLGLLRPGMSLSEAQRAISNLSSRQFTIPGEAGFPLNGMFQLPNRGEAEQLRSYLSTIRTETAARLLSRVYAQGSQNGQGGQNGQDGQSPSKWWLAFHKRKFMNKSLSSN